MTTNENADSSSHDEPYQPQAGLDDHRLAVNGSYHPSSSTINGDTYDTLKKSHSLSNGIPFPEESQTDGLPPTDPPTLTVTAPSLQSLTAFNDDIEPPIPHPIEEAELAAESPKAASETDYLVPKRPVNRTIRFRSRVRITSGLHSSSSRKPTHGREQSKGSLSSRSSSPSSSISAPLRSSRSASDIEDNKSGWVPLGMRIGILTRERKMLREQRRRMLSGADSDEPSERTRLNGHPNVHIPRYVEGEGVQRDPYADSDEDEDAAYAEEVDEEFGKWPRRLLNPHWWWWQLGPVICCCKLHDQEIERDEQGAGPPR